MSWQRDVRTVNTKCINEVEWKHASQKHTDSVCISNDIWTKVPFYCIVMTLKYFATVLVLLLEVKVQFVGLFKG